MVIPTRRSSWCLRRKNGKQTTSRWVLLESRKNQVTNTTQQHGTKCRSCKQPCDMRMKQSIAFSSERDLTCREKHRHKCCSHISCIPLCQVGPVSDEQVFEDLKYQAYVHAFPVQTSDASNFCIFFQLLQIKYDFLGPAAFAQIPPQFFMDWVAFKVWRSLLLWKGLRIEAQHPTKRTCKLRWSFKSW